MRANVLLAAAAILAVIPAASANPLKSLYTTIDLRECKRTGKGSDGPAWLCGGLGGYSVSIAEDRRRTFVSVGREPLKRRAAGQTLKAPNSLFRDRSQRATIEWRFVRHDGKVAPFATIQRFFTSRGKASGEVLVISKVTPGEDCHVAYVDALANPDAIVLAREIADNEARKFDCTLDPRVAGVTGRSPM